MNYQISEDEFNLLDAVRGQIGLVCGLLTANGADGSLFDTSDLYDFLAAQFDTIKGVLEASTARLKDQNIKDELGAADLMHMIRIAGGDLLHSPHGAENDITRKLELAARINAAMAWPRDEWRGVMLKVASAQQAQAAPKAPPKRANPKAGAAAR